MDLEVKQIIDKHYTVNIRYYEVICKTLYKDRYLWEDLLQETYLGLLKVKPEVIKYSSDKAYLLHIGKKVIYSILQKRGFCKKYKNGSDSVFFETANLSSNYNFDLLITEQAERKDTDKIIDQINSIVYDGLENKNFDVEVFVMSQIEHITSISRRTGVSRHYIYKSINKVTEDIKEKLKPQLHD